MIVKRYAFTDDLAAIRTIWSAAFPEDTAADRDRFLQTVRLSEECLVAVENGVPVSMVFMLPATYGERRLQYIYAAATLPSHRGCGIFGDLLRTAIKHAREQGCAASFLRPAEPSLVGYYARFGYLPWCGCHTETGDAKANGEHVTVLSPDAFAERRAARLPSHAVGWESRFAAYAASCGVAADTERATALCNKQGNTLFIKEVLGDADPAALSAALGCDRFVWRRQGGDEPFMLWLPFEEMSEATAPYVGLALD